MEHHKDYTKRINKIDLLKITQVGLMVPPLACIDWILQQASVSFGISGIAPTCTSGPYLESQTLITNFSLNNGKETGNYSLCLYIGFLESSLTDVLNVKLPHLAETNLFNY